MANRALNNPALIGAFVMIRNILIDHSTFFKEIVYSFHYLGLSMAFLCRLGLLWTRWRETGSRAENVFFRLVSSSCQFCLIQVTQRSYIRRTIYLHSYYKISPHCKYLSQRNENGNNRIIGNYALWQ